MCIYCGTKKYRRIYEQHYGPIPKEDNGRSYEIHHIDGNHSNNHPDNLISVTLQEHYDIHFSQSDWGACYLMGGKLKLDPNILSSLLKLQSAERIKNGTHNFLNAAFQQHYAQKRVENGTHHWLGDGSFQRNVQMKRVNDGTHHLLSGNIQREHAKKNVRKSIENGTNMFMNMTWQKQKAKDQLSKGTHPSQYQWICESCGLSGKGRSQLSRHRTGKNCNSTDIT